jgi:hypothetical protein
MVPVHSRHPRFSTVWAKNRAAAASRALLRPCTRPFPTLLGHRCSTPVGALTSTYPPGSHCSMVEVVLKIHSPQGGAGSNPAPGTGFSHCRPPLPAPDPYPKIPTSPVRFARMRGTMRERRPGVWEIRVYVGRDEQGRPSRKPHRARRKRKAEDVMRALHDEVRRGKHRTTRGTVAHLLARYMATSRRSGRLAVHSPQLPQLHRPQHRARVRAPRRGRRRPSR